MPQKSSIRRSRAYAAPAPDDIVQTTLDRLLNGRRPLRRQQGRLSLDEESKALAGRRVWYAGNAALIQKVCVAIVGTRDVSDAGATRARRLGRELAAQGAVVVSGLAKGVDTEALRAAIEAGGRVIAVIGTPLERAYPAENGPLQELIARDHLLISPFDPGSKTYPSHFPERNRVMAAVSDATAIIEASDTSGTLHQAAECLRLDRWLFIAKNVMDDTTLLWPSRFRAYERTRTLSDTNDISLTLAIGAS